MDEATDPPAAAVAVDRATKLRKRKALHQKACDQVRAALTLLTSSTHEDTAVLHSVNCTLLEASDTLDLLED